jgi:hypothetical protein
MGLGALKTDAPRMKVGIFPMKVDFWRMKARKKNRQTPAWRAGQGAGARNMR